MMSEITPVSLKNLVIAPFESNLRIKQDRALPVGAIIFDNSTKYVAVARNGNTFGGEYRDLPQGFKRTHVTSGFGRVHDFSSFKMVDVAQVGLDAVRVTSSPSFRRKASVGVVLEYTNISDGSLNPYFMEEIDILSAFTGRGGGIAIFEGPEAPEETALVLDKQVGSDKQRLVFFIHPEEKDIDLGSTAGLGAFLQQLNEQFLRTHSLLQDKAIEALRKDVASGNIGFDLGDVRGIALQTQFIAHARMAEIYPDDRSYEQFLIDHSPSMRPTLGQKIREFFNPGERETARTKALQASVDSLIVSDAGETIKPVKSETQDLYRVQALILELEEAPHLKELVISMGDDYAKEGEPMKAFLIAVMEYFIAAKNATELDAVMKVIDNLAETEFKNKNEKWFVRRNEPGNVCGLGYDDWLRARQYTELFTELKAEYIKKRNRFKS